MLPTKTNGFEVTSTLKGENIALGIHADSMSYIMRLLTDLYSDPAMAAVREYATNARDAHVAAGKANVPIEVSTPTALSPFLTIEDFGVGLSLNDLRHVYSQYGASTKRDSNEQQGTFGLGCKSALTYTNQFTVVATKDGQRAQVVVSRDEKGSGGMTVVDVSPTDAPNGVKIIIPAKDARDLADKGERLFRYWPKGSVKLNGTEPTPLRERDGSLILNDRMYIYKDDGVSVVVMGGVAYPWENPEHYGVKFRTYKHGLVAHVEVGELDLPPSREALMYTDKTKATLQRIGEEFKAAAVNIVQKEVGKAQTAHDAITAMACWDEVLYRPGSKALSWKGTPIPDYWEIAGRRQYGQEWPMTLVAAKQHYYGTLSAHDKTDRFVIERIPKTVFVTGFTFKFSANHRRKLDQWRATNAPDAEYFAFLRADQLPAGDPWAAQNQVVGWDVIKAEKLPQTTTSAVSQKNIPGSYECYIDGVFQSEVAGNDINTSRPLYYLQGNWHTAAPYASVISAGTIVCLPLNRVDKFVRLFPKAKKVEDAVRPAFERWVKSLTPEQKTVIKIEDDNQDYALRRWNGLDESKVNDPELKRTGRLAKVSTDGVSKARTRFSQLGFSGLDIKADKWDDPLVHYPLFDRQHLRFNSLHVYMYLNAAYAARTGKAGA